MHPTRLLLIFWILLFLHMIPGNALVINEIMYDPLVNDSYNEWIEIYNPSAEVISLENWTLCNVSLLKGYVNYTDKFIYSNTTFDLQPSSFAVITDGGSGTQAYDNYNISGLALHTAVSTLCGGLDNINGTITLENSTYNFSVFYNSSMGAVNNNKTLCFLPGSLELQECLPTPGTLNYGLPAEQNQTNQTINISTPSSVLVNDDFYLFGINSSNCSSSFFLGYNISNSTYFINGSETVGCGSYFQTSVSSPGILDICWFVQETNSSNCSILQINGTNNNATCNISLEINAPIFVNASESFDYSLDFSSYPCLDQEIGIEYWIEDLFGTAVKDKTITNQTLLCSKSVSRKWTPPAGNGSAYIIFAHALNCVSPLAEKVIAIKGEKQLQSSISITYSDPAVIFGNILDVELEIYRGATSKYAIEIWTESNKKSSPVYTIHLKDPYTLYHFKIPIQIKMNCDNSINSGTHTLHVEGLDVTATKTITIQGSSSQCPAASSSSSSSSSSTSSSSSLSSSSSSSIKPQTIEVDFTAPQEAEPGKEISIQATISNQFSSVKNISVYSYIYKGSSLASEGGWSPNPKNIIINSSKTASILLKNSIKDDIEGIYFLRVRAKDLVSNKTYDNTSEIFIAKTNERVAVSVKLNGTINETINQTINETKNETAPENTSIAQLSITGLSTANTQPEDGHKLSTYLFQFFRFMLTKKMPAP
jgi:Lamin Tail Domain